MRYEIRIQPIRYNDRRYGLSTGGELAAIIPYSSLENEATSEYRDNIFCKRSGNGIQFQRISQLRTSYDPLHFVYITFQWGKWLG